MSQALSFAHARGWNLAIKLMVCITVFVPATETTALCLPQNITVIPPPSL